MKQATGRRCRYALFALGLLLSVAGCKKNPAGPGNTPPALHVDFKFLPLELIHSGDQVAIAAEVRDDQPLDSLDISWKATGGIFVSTSKQEAIWEAPQLPGVYTVYAIALDREGISVSDSIKLIVENRPPEITALDPLRAAAILGNRVTFRATAIDSDQHRLTFSWQAEKGFIEHAAGDSMQWQAPLEPATVKIVLAVTDAYAAVTRDTAVVIVYREAGSVWIADTGNSEVAKISAEGDLLFRVSGFQAPVAIATDASRRAVWVADLAAGEAVKLSVTGKRQNAFTGLGGPVDLDNMQVDGHVWVVEQDSSAVTELSNNAAARARKIVGFSHPSAIAIDQRRAEIYIADTGAHRVVRLSNLVPDGYSVASDSGYHATFTGFDAPVDVVSELHTQRIWVVDNFLQSVFALENGGSPAFGISGLNLPRALAVDDRTGAAWIADSGNGRIVKVVNANIVTQINGFLVPYSLVVDSNSGAVWVVDTENDRIVKCSASGEKLTSIYGFSSPRAVAINTGQ